MNVQVLSLLFFGNQVHHGIEELQSVSFSSKYNAVSSSGLVKEAFLHPYDIL